MNRFALFIFPGYYPEGGMDDFKESFDEIHHAKSYAAGWFDTSRYADYQRSTPEQVQKNCHMHIYDIRESKMVCRKEGGKDWISEDDFQSQNWLNE